MSLDDTLERPAAPPLPPPRPLKDALVVRFAGDSGDGVQLAGHQFATATAAEGADLMTLPEFPAEIRAPTGTTFGVSAYQVQFGPGEVLDPGRRGRRAGRVQPRRLRHQYPVLKRGGTVVYDEGAFNERAYGKANIAGNPVDASRHGAVPRRYRLRSRSARSRRWQSSASAARTARAPRISGRSACRSGCAASTLTRRSAGSSGASPRSRPSSAARSRR